MGAPAVRETNNRLPDGRSIRALEGTFTQKQMFTLRSSGLYAPQSEGIMSVKDHDQSFQSSVCSVVDVSGWWRTCEYAFYPRGFEKRDLPLGDKLVYVEDGFTHTLSIPDVPVSIVRSDGKSETIGLRQAIGMGIIKLEKLDLRQIDERADEVSVTTDFDPATDVKVVDIMRPKAWALVDADGYPLKSKPSSSKVSGARCPYVRDENGFEAGSTGYHGSLARGADRPIVDANDKWQYGSGVALVGSAAAPQIAVASTPENKAC